MLQAEQKAKAIDASEYDYFYNSCVHYAGQIWQSLGFKQTYDMANFLVDNIINDQDVRHLRAAKKKGGLRALAAITLGGKGGFKKYVQGVVYSQLDLVY